MTSPKHPGSPDWTGPTVAQNSARTKQETSATGPDLPSSGPEEHLDASNSLNSNSSMTTKELQEYWQNEKCHWKPVKLLFEIASAHIEERKASKFVMYQIVVIQTGSFDSNKAIVERRFSDFVSLQERLEESQLRKPTPRGLTLKELTVREYLY
ncbi:PREDICTED: sorting nexin-20 isoform X2 [Chrysochloris asiatica]|uniref:Sorting nexin-20 isoform X2 n=1 Tax=Chrysochloris asiatica TaxID=185453 RepID=A0A9B0WYW6_CHRAS|nr:PREDICTED: sorting nexin-20 isoform X2 [Chrysochloris asiatica]